MVGATALRRRVCVQLDAAVLCEGLVLRRLAATPKSRQQEWLRALLVNGLLWERRAARLVDAAWDNATRASAAQNEGAVVPSSSFARWLDGANAPQRVCRADHKGSGAARSESVSESSNAKPFAHLRKVIG